MYIQWLLLALSSCLMSLIAFPLALILPLFKTQDNHLPRWLSWFDTPDNTLDGDGGHEERWKGYPRYIKQVAWLMRNRAYGYGFFLGRSIDATNLIIQGEPYVSNRPLKNGRCLSIDPSSNTFMFYYVKSYSSKRCIRILLGWKLMEATQKRTGNYDVSICHAISFTMGYST